MTEEVVQFGESGRLMGVLTTPEGSTAPTSEKEVFIFLSSGLLHRVGPRRLYVTLARELAAMGFSALRVDLSGRGDSLPPRAPTSSSTLERDWDEISSMLKARLGSCRYVVGGLCSAADDAIKIAHRSDEVIGLLLLDPVSEKDTGFRRREILMRYGNPRRYLLWLRRRLTKLFSGPESGGDTPSQAHVDPLALRDQPTTEMTREAFTSIRNRGGKVLSVFTSYALEYLNQEGQMGRVLALDGYQDFCTERFWPEAAHSFPLHVHRERLCSEVKQWAIELEA